MLNVGENGSTPLPPSRVNHLGLSLANRVTQGSMIIIYLIRQDDNIMTR